MHLSKAFLLLFALPLCAAGASPVLFGSAFAGPLAPSTLYSISASTGAATAIGPIGFTSVGAMDFAPNGTIYGIGFAGVTNMLITINTTTGAGTAVAPITGGGWNPGLPAQDMAFRPGDGTLFAYQGVIGSTDHGFLYTINTTTGAATLVGDDLVGFPIGSGLAFGASLYLAGAPNLYILNQATGQASIAVALTFPPAFGPINPRIPGMKTDPATGTIWGVVFSGNPVTQASLGTLNPSTGVMTFIGPTHLGMDALAVQHTVAVPALSRGVPVLTAVLLLGMAMFALRRRVSAQ